MRTSILVTTYNRPKLLAACLDSIARQSDPRWEVLIADDHSSLPQVRQLCLDFQARHLQRVEYWDSGVLEEERSQRVRFSVNINQLVARVRGELMMYLCDDVELLPHALAIIHAAFRKQPELQIGYVGQAMIDADAVTGERLGKRWEVRSNADYGKALTGAFCQVDHSQVVHRREYFRRWPEAPEHWHHADGLVFDDILKVYNALLLPIGDVKGDPLVIYKVTDTSICRQPVEEALARLRTMPEVTL